MPVEFDRSNSTGQIGCKSIEIDASQIGCKSIEITLPVKGFRCWSSLTSRIGCKSIEIDAGQIGCKSIEITLYACLVESVELGVNPLRLHCLLKALDAGRI